MLATLDETTYHGDGAMGRDHPIAWAHEFDGGRAWYTGGGHTEESYSEPPFRAHLLGGIRYAAGLAPPSILSVATTVRSRRMAVAVQVRGLSAVCRTNERATATPNATVPMRFGGGSARATTPRSPPAYGRSS